MIRINFLKSKDYKTEIVFFYKDIFILTRKVRVPVTYHSIITQQASINDIFVTP
jgi:hypothetical protein